MKLTIAWSIGLMLAGCAAQTPQVVTRVVEVPSSKPYSYLKWSTACPAPVNKGIRSHNRAHQSVIEAERKVQP